VDLNRTPGGDPVRILDERTNSIAGVRVDSLHRKITEPRLRAEIQKALERLTLHVAYTKEPGSKWEKRKQFKSIMHVSVQFVVYMY
jgi:hypothetical protein